MTFVPGENPDGDRLAKLNFWFARATHQFTQTSLFQQMASTDRDPNYSLKSN